MILTLVETVRRVPGVMERLVSVASGELSLETQLLLGGYNSARRVIYHMLSQTKNGDFVIAALNSREVNGLSSKRRLFHSTIIFRSQSRASKFTRHVRVNFVRLLKRLTKARKKRTRQL